MDAVLVHRVFSSHTHTMLDLSLGSPRTMGNRFVHGRRFALCFVLGNCTKTTKTCVCVCELLSRRNRVVARILYCIYIRFPPTNWHTPSPSPAHIRLLHSTLLPTSPPLFDRILPDTVCLFRKWTHLSAPTYTQYTVPFRSKEEVATGQFYPSSHFKTISKGRWKMPVLIKQ